jgi:hypothetical protein
MSITRNNRSHISIFCIQDLQTNVHNVCAHAKNTVVETLMGDDSKHKLKMSKRTCALWRPRTHIFWKSFTLGHLVARDISNQPVVPLSKLGVLSAWSIRIWWFKQQNLATVNWPMISLQLSCRLLWCAKTLVYVMLQYHYYPQNLLIVEKLGARQRIQMQLANSALVLSPHRMICANAAPIKLVS